MKPSVRFDAATQDDDAFFAAYMRAATALRDAGLGTGEVVAVMLRNEPALLELMLAARWIGARWCPINWHFKAAEVRHILVDSEAKLLVVHADLLGADRRRDPGVGSRLRRRAAAVHPARLRPGRRLAAAGASGRKLGGFPRRRARGRARAAGARQRDGLHLGHDRAAEGHPARAGHARAARAAGRAQPGRARRRARHARARQRAALPLGAGGLRGAGGAERCASGARAEVRRRADAAARRIGAAHAPLPGADDVRAPASSRRGRAPPLRPELGALRRLERLAVRGRREAQDDRLVGSGVPRGLCGERARLDLPHRQPRGPAAARLGGPGDGRRAAQGAVERRAGGRAGHGGAAVHARSGRSRLHLCEQRRRPAQARARRPLDARRHGLPRRRRLPLRRRPAERHGDRRRRQHLSGRDRGGADHDAGRRRLRRVRHSRCRIRRGGGGGGAAGRQRRPRRSQVRAFLRERLADFKVPRVVAFHDELPREDTGKIFKRRLREPYWAGRERRI